ncbi:hypothetical protein CspHIS471_0610510 [Cutaneotrichosporon sp. HIS471]|nr:hypothetical protein CspHIS471_0610510 [Cutaneotrichosporon sp. HIS471]
MITLTPLSSSASSSSASEPVAYFLELDDARILLDMGQRDYRASLEQDNWEYENKIKELAPTLSLVLLSHSPSTYLGLYPYARAHWGLKCPVYATQPTVEMGRVVCLSEAESWRSECPVEEADGEEDTAIIANGSNPPRGRYVPTVEEIHEAFNHIKAIRYNQPLHLGGDLSHLLVTPFPSGHVLGGTLFKIRSPTSGTVLYAVGMNHTGERHIDGMVTGQGGLAGYAEDIRRPDLLIVEGDRALVTNPKRRDRETAILDVITNTLQSGHSVLMPSDPSPRLLELLVLLDQHWSFKINPTGKPDPGPASASGWKFPLCVVSRTAQDMVNFARSLIEWMGGVVRESSADDVMGVQAGRGRKRRARQIAVGSEYGALDFNHVDFFSSLDMLLLKHPVNEPKLVIAVPITMSHGPSRFLFTIMASKPGNVVLLTNRGEDNTLARELYELWESEQTEDAKWGHGKIGKVIAIPGPLKFEMDERIPLGGEELEVYEEKERQKKEREAAQQAALDRSKRMLEADDLESDSDSDSEDDGAGGLLTARTEGANAIAGDSEDVRTMSFDIFVKGQQTRVGRGVAGEMARFRMFPFLAKARRVDSYGEGLDIGQWVRKGREIEEEGETEEVRDAKRRKLEEEEKAAVPPEPPSKFISNHVTLQPRASVDYVDMDGMHDGQAIKTIIADLQPRKLVLVKSNKASTEALLEFFKSTPSITREVFYPDTNESVRIGEHVQSFSLQLGDSISALLSGKWSKFEGYEVAMVDGKLAYASGSTVPLLEAPSVELPPMAEVKEEPEAVAVAVAVAEAEAEAEAPIEVAEAAEDIAMEEGKPDIVTDEPATMANEETAADEAVIKAEPIEVQLEVEVVEKPVPTGPAALPGSLFIGDLRLLALKNRLAGQKIDAQFAGEGVLVCGSDKGSMVVVRKLGAGQIVLEGAVSRTYFAVRKELYGSYAQVTAM